MNPILSDIRILKMAEMYERAYEGFVPEMVERHVKDDSLKTRLRALAAPTDGHGERIAARIERPAQPAESFREGARSVLRAPRLALAV